MDTLTVVGQKTRDLNSVGNCEGKGGERCKSVSGLGQLRGSVYGGGSDRVRKKKK